MRHQVLTYFQNYFTSHMTGKLETHLPPHPKHVVKYSHF